MSIMKRKDPEWIILFPEGDRSLDTIQTGPRVQNCIYNETKRNKEECLLDTFHKHLSQSV